MAAELQEGEPRQASLEAGGLGEGESSPSRVAQSEPPRDPHPQPAQLGRKQEAALGSQLEAWSKWSNPGLSPGKLLPGETEPLESS